MKKLTAAAIAGALALSMAETTVAADQFERAIEYRQSAFKMIRGNFGPMGAMVRGEMPFDAEAFARHANNLAALSTMAHEGFIDGSDLGETDAKPEIWEKRADFDSIMAKFEESAAKLAAAAEGGNMRNIRPSFIATAETCKSCHDNYRKD